MNSFKFMLKNFTSFTEKWLYQNAVDLDLVLQSPLGVALNLQPALNFTKSSIALGQAGHRIRCMAWSHLSVWKQPMSRHSRSGLDRLQLLSNRLEKICKSLLSNVSIQTDCKHTNTLSRSALMSTTRLWHISLQGGTQLRWLTTGCILVILVNGKRTSLLYTTHIHLPVHTCSYKHFLLQLSAHYLTFTHIHTLTFTRIFQYKSKVYMQKPQNKYRLQITVIVIGQSNPILVILRYYELYLVIYLGCIRIYIFRKEIWHMMIPNNRKLENWICQRAITEDLPV